MGDGEHVRKTLGPTMIGRRAVALALAAGLGGVGVAGVSGGARAADEANYLLSTASTGGTYYPVGVAIATLTKVRLTPKEKIGMSAINSAGSAENVRLLREGEAQFAILQGLYGHYAATGSGPVTEPQDNLRSVSMLWENVEQFVISTDALDTGTVADLTALKGKTAAFGRQNSGTIGSNRHLLSGLGLDVDADFELLFAGYGPSA
ncbi:MAG: TAXI family TRAP transporter solute-binding subunit, partial [Pseudomonadota bacterium]